MRPDRMRTMEIPAQQKVVGAWSRKFLQRLNDHKTRQPGKKIGITSPIPAAKNKLGNDMAALKPREEAASRSSDSNRGHRPGSRPLLADSTENPARARAKALPVSEHKNTVIDPVPHAAFRRTITSQEAGHQLNGHDVVFSSAHACSTWSGEGKEER